MITSLGNIATRKATRLILVAVVVLTMAGMVFGFALPDAALAWDNCPKGLTNDPYPGACRRYVDTNGDDICDLSQSKPVASTTTTLPVSTTEPASTSGTTKVTAAAGSLATTSAASGEPPTGNCPLGPCIGCRACVSISVDVQDGANIANSDAATTGAATAAGPADVTAAAGTTTSGGSSILTHYLVAPVALAFLLIYGVSFVLYKIKKIRITTHRKVWNVMLLGTFLVTGIFGLILTIQLDYTLPFTLPVNLLFWHVEAGIAMTLISLFHMGWHFNYYKNLVWNTRKRAREAREAERDGRRGARTAPRRATQPALRPVPRRSLVPDNALAAQAREQRRAEREAQRLREESDHARRQAYPAANARPWLEPETD